MLDHEDICPSNGAIDREVRDMSCAFYARPVAMLVTIVVIVGRDWANAKAL